MASEKENLEKNRKRLEQLKISRRTFLRATGAVGGAIAAESLLRATPVRANEDFEGYPNRYGLLSDTTKCVGCRQCEAACARVNNLPKIDSPHDQSIMDKKRRTSARQVTVVNRYTNTDAGRTIYRKEQCMHCNEPACVSACLVAALKKTPEGAVTYNENVCIGCRYCMLACPFNQLAYDYKSAFTPVVRKCNLCFQRIRVEGGVPACVAVCPAKALHFGQRDDLLKLARETIVKNPGKYVDHIYGEHEAGGTSWMYLAAVPFEQLGLPINVGKTPFIEYTKTFLVGVPLMYVIWPPLLAGINALIKRKERIAEEEAKAKKEDGR